MRDKPGKRPSCLHERTFAGQVQRVSQIRAVENLRIFGIMTFFVKNLLTNSINPVK